ncbi:hypothetical protein P879_08177 [Paragonimus westermani]|uniref:WAC domain-containing protein n=1 Tax=Paragonimus westermani TaxID=34504 RepID=A0A8T0D654_9TREM|nr:hypothetical protein P879_08177 [Paragonimus westermani]
MPLLNGEKFVKRQPPKNFSPTEELFFSPVTLEVFREYDEYFERTILVNSVTWQCSLCGRGPMTFAAAASCERADCRELDSFGSSLVTGLLYIIHQSKRQRLSELVDLLCGFAANRFFVGEPILYSFFTTSKTRSDGYVKRVLLASSVNNSRDAKVDLPPNSSGGVLSQSGLVEPSAVLYQVDNIWDDVPFERRLSPPLLLPFNNIHRRSNNAVTRERVRFLIRHTCELKNGCFTPKIIFMQRYKVHPHGPFTWADLFMMPEPDWAKCVRHGPNLLHSQQYLMSNVHSVNCETNYSQLSRNFSSSSSSYRVVDTFSDGRRVTNLEQPNWSSWKQSQKLPVVSYNSAVLPTGLMDHARKQSLEDITKSHLNDGYKNSVDVSWVHHPDANQAWQSERLERAERSILEREWLAVRRREDLELSDLVPLPEFPIFPSRIPPEDLGTAFQLFEFFHVFGNQLNLQVHSYERVRGRRVHENLPLTLSWSALEAALVESNPCGPLADIIVGLLCAIRRFDAEANNRQITPSVLAATHAAAAAVAAAERGSSLALYTIGHASDYGTLYEELTTGPDASNYLRVLRDAAVATRLSELVGIPSPTVSQAAGKAAIVVASAEDPAEKGTIKEDQFQSIPSRNSNARAVTMATLAGATSLCPLDRAGLTKALWLHLVGAVARVGGWRGQIWGGARPLDDPAVMLARDHPSLLEKLNEVSVYELATHEKLLLLTCLMDQLALYPQLRDHLEEQFERQRLLRTRLRALRSDSWVDESVPESTSIGVQRVKSTSRGGRATGQSGCGAYDKPNGPKPSSQSSSLEKMDDSPRTRVIS